MKKLNISIFKMVIMIISLTGLMYFDAFAINKFEVKNEITALTESSITVDGKEFIVDQDTNIISKSEGQVDLSYLETEMIVEIEGYVLVDGNIAVKIKIEDENEDKTKIEIQGEITELTDDLITVDSVSFLLTSRQ